MELSFEEIRVLGCLVEKSANTPEHYPLTSNSLTAACNQKSSRHPVVSLTTRQVDETVMLLRQAGLARSNMGGRASKHRHIMEEALGLTLNQTIVLSVMMLRGPQSAGELKTRTDRAIGFTDVGDVDQVLQSLADREEPFVVDIGRGAGQSMTRWAHLLGGEPDHAEAYAAAIEPSGPRSSAGATGVAAQQAETIGQLEQRIAELETRLARIESELGL